MHHFHALKVAAVEPQTREAVAVTLKVPPELEALFRYAQGQHLTLRTHLDGEEVRRSYSICSAVQDNRLRIAIKRVPGGLFSNWANDHLRSGMSLDVMPPAGHFGLETWDESARHYVAFAAGSGITPILSIIKTTLQSEPRARFTLIYGNRASSSVLFKEELEDLKDRYLDRLRLVFVLSREAQEIELFNGRIDGDKVDALLRAWIAPGDINAAYVCGPLDMMEQTRDALARNGVDPSAIRLELFATSAAEAQARQRVSAHEAPAGECEVSVVLDGRIRHFSVSRGGDNLLEAALAHNIELPFSCKGGVCSSCRCKLTEGEVDMNAVYALEDYEIERGFVLACQSYALSDRVTLDFDQET